jgi:AAA domain
MTEFAEKFEGVSQRRGRRRQANANGASTAEALVLSLNEIDAGDDPGRLTPRGWLVGNQFCRQFLSSLFATGGVGKSALRMAQFIAAATKRQITGQHIFLRCRVLLLSFEDDNTELQRRIAACLIHHGIERSELKGWLFFASPKNIKLAEMRGGSRQIGQLEKLLRDTIGRRKPDILGLDPFVKLHALEENDNGAMDFVCDLLTKLAIEYDLAVDVPHHTRKGLLVAGDADTGRGGSSIKDAGRLVYTLTVMSPDEGKALGISETDRSDYVRLDPAKVNIVRRSQRATWFRLVSVRLGNGTIDADGNPGGLYPNGDEVQTVEPWSPPDTWADLSTVVLNTVLTAIDAGLPNGQRYFDAPKVGDRAAWAVVQRHCSNKTEPQCREIIRTWVKNGVLFKEQYDDPVERKPRSGLRRDTSKRPG